MEWQNGLPAVPPGAAVVRGFQGDDSAAAFSSSFNTPSSIFDIQPPGKLSGSRIAKRVVPLLTAHDRKSAWLTRIFHEFWNS